ncbi:uncharacterized protein SETTUDRAFT_157133 [Exserohilum turcica Et28A]|uniref:Uncharacterized protein n=1 Tax=Exserohilum turcicum (strain 28A) TaxID=671987 RepID=R0IAF2_EXST2|nr:uncharacterized protein SETTUDRAFT_157133 [Exserohilum turcica Et28A]EOA82306.1 hypothetical protein SETTUDRAFT_157133 [Exserohilum turcica Et28A]
MTHFTNRPGNNEHVLCRQKLETLPVEIVNRILCYLIHPRCRLPGLTEAQSGWEVSEKQKRSIKNQEDLTQSADTHRWAADIFSLRLVSHPFNALALTSRTCHALVEAYCAHLVRRCNRTMFNLPFAQLDMYGPNCVYPDLSSIVYRRLWLQHAPRMCVYCHATLDCYPFSRVNRLFTACEGCFYRQAMTIEEVQRQYHLSPTAIHTSHRIRGNPNSPWILRVDVEALALQLYRTRQFHDAHPEQFGKPCSMCAITRFTHRHDVKKSPPSQKYFMAEH